MNYQRRYYPKRPVKSFQDLEVYQKALGLAVEVAKKIETDQKVKKNIESYQSIVTNLIETALRLPKVIATAHSLRFGDPSEGVANLEKAMLDCNLMAVYLEQYRDLSNNKIGHEFFEEQIKEYLRVRGKILRLQKSWLKFLKLGENVK